MVDFWSSYNLRSDSSLLLEPPKEKMLATLGARSFYAAAPCLVNSLPTELRDIKCNLETHLFGQVFFLAFYFFIKIVRFYLLLLYCFYHFIF